MKTDEFKLPLCNGDHHCAVITCYSHEDHPPRIPGQQEYSTDPELFNCFLCTEELKLSFEKRTFSYDLSSGGVINFTESTFTTSVVIVITVVSII